MYDEINLIIDTIIVANNATILNTGITIRNGGPKWSSLSCKNSVKSDIVEFFGRCSQRINRYNIIGPRYDNRMIVVII